MDLFTQKLPGVWWGQKTTSFHDIDAQNVFSFIDV
jgi:hypothetical protein